uniref:Hypothetical secreted peptide 1159 n=1 Tax=Amblyomma variegatum TaxID=34610 RepID=F0J9T3_AMBVA|nr:TPA_inf: hypothetical secreted peptide precursor 1159 [Amblyomma variegatum]
MLQQVATCRVLLASFYCLKFIVCLKITFRCLTYKAFLCNRREWGRGEGVELLTANFHL